MATVTQFWSPNPPFQAHGTVEWVWAHGDNNFFWSFAVRPRQANSQVEVVREWTTSDNDLNQKQHFLVTSSPFDRAQRHPGAGTLLMFTAIKVEEP